MKKNTTILFALLKADFLERTRSSAFLVTLCLAIYLGYAVNSGQILIKLGAYRGVYNSAWVGSLMTLTVTFFLGLAGFYLVKDSLGRDERSGVGQILATTSLNRVQYLLGKWLSNFAVLSALVGILALAAILMQLVQGEETQIQLWALLAPFLFIALPMLALVAALAIFFESASWLKGGFGNLVYFFVFIFLLVLGVQMPQYPWLDATGLNLVGAGMKAGARAAFPAYDGTFTLAMISANALQTFRWGGLSWTGGLIAQRLLWFAVALGVVLAALPFFKRFDPNTSVARAKRKLFAGRKNPAGDSPDFSTWASSSQNLEAENGISNGPVPSKSAIRKTRKLSTSSATIQELLPGSTATPLRPRLNLLHLAWLEGLLLLKGLKWYWLLGMLAFWVACAAAPTANLRRIGFELAAIWPVLVWSQMGARVARYHSSELLFSAVKPRLKLFLPGWLAGVGLSALALSGSLLGRMVYHDPLALLPWTLAVLFIPSLAIALGSWSHGSKAFEVVYPVLWYLGPLNPQNGLAVLDYLGLHPTAPVNTQPLAFAAVTLALALLGWTAQERK